MNKQKKLLRLETKDHILLYVHQKIEAKKQIDFSTIDEGGEV
jgi:hypothetical protein